MLTELLVEAAIVVAAVGLSAVLGYMWRTLLRFPPLLLALGVAFLAVAVWLVAHVSLPSTDGSPAGAGIFVMYASAVMSTGAVGIFFTTLALVRMTEATGVHPTLRAVACLMLVCLLTAGATVQQRWQAEAANEARLAAERAEARALREPRWRDSAPYEQLPPRKAAARATAERARYDECVAYMRAAQRRETLASCADELVTAWDASLFTGSRFANMPDHGGFAGNIGALYASHAQATGRYAAARERVRAVRSRTRQRYPDDQASLRRLDEILEELR